MSAPFDAEYQAPQGAIYRRKNTTIRVLSKRTDSLGDVLKVEVWTDRGWADFDCFEASLQWDLLAEEVFFLLGVEA